MNIAVLDIQNTGCPWLEVFDQKCERSELNWIQRTTNSYYSLSLSIAVSSTALTQYSVGTNYNITHRIHISINRQKISEVIYKHIPLTFVINTQCRVGFAGHWQHDHSTIIH